MTLEETMNANKGIGPGFHLLRHVLAALILIYHCTIAVFGAHTNDYMGKGLLLAQKAGHDLTMPQLLMEVIRPTLYTLVGMFFALSGFLVTSSALRNGNIKVFFLNRAVRIIPALSVEITLSALILGPLVTNLPLGQYFSDPRFFRYFGNIAGFVTFTLPGVFTDNPWPNIVNLNLWTLPPEFWCYLLMLGLMISGLLSKQKLLTAGIIFAIFVATALDIFDHHTFTIKENNTRFTVWYIVMMFFIGMLFCVNAKHVILNVWLALGCALGFYVLTLSDSFGPLSGLLLTYLTAYIGMIRFPLFDRILKEDLSYGIYLYGFPLTQVTIFFLLPHLGFLPGGIRLAIITLISFCLTLIFASLSWKFIEKPALRLRKWGQKKSVPISADEHGPAQSVPEGLVPVTDETSLRPAQ
ncbi:acyltransferase family protein [Beijerinckia indica]|uniref:Acyltransferase 3 n=1 Tax=Beijerinckia indica subsp. indica (strain ATCC 9039 / DSM 1715 / NCIMB 8712) TaxID=395963 RepID=B2ILN9_BEII9|nr:acyltransferase [Beijerinckia indica]ACB97439.1 acyltransferase 3 [Beijerinckia indica subsp. indica ATCC 9039]